MSNYYFMYVDRYKAFSPVCSLDNPENEKGITLYGPFPDEETALKQRRLEWLKKNNKDPDYLPDHIKEKMRKGS